MRGVVEFRLRFPIDQVRDIASRYRYPGEDKVISIGNEIRDKGCAGKRELLEIVAWKSKRRLGLFRDNSESDLRAVMNIAFSSGSEAVRIGVLRALPGVDYPVASTFLHFCHVDDYPIIDRRALWSLGFQRMPAYSLSLWLGYLSYCRSLAKKASVDMRTLDRALWQYSESNQGGAFR